MNHSSHRCRAVTLAILCVVGAATSASAAAPPLRSQDLVYRYDEMFDFDIDAWLARNAPHLASQAETISHWAGFSGVSPRVLIALMELQSGVVGNPEAGASAIARPFGALVREHGFGEQMRELAQSLRDAMYDPDDRRTRGPVQLSPLNPLRVLYTLSGTDAAQASVLADERFQQVYRRLFDTLPQAHPASARFAVPTAGTPPTDMLQFPYPLGEKWHIGGAHTNSGSGRFPLSSLDMSQGGFWGSDQSKRRVSASAAGVFKRHSSCMAEIIHAGGWSTTYYHLMNILPATGTRVEANAPIANPANTRRQALCDGGRSTGPHQHWSLKSAGSQHHLHGVTLSSYRVTATGSSYDTNCTRFNLSRKGRTYCADWYTNIGVDAP